jgi:hypothetical protein
MNYLTDRCQEDKERRRAEIVDAAEAVGRNKSDPAGNLRRRCPAR